jgi:hypothetical protein
MHQPRSRVVALLCAALLGVAAGGAWAETKRPPPRKSSAPKADERVYTWVDDQGVTHYGDSVPAEYSEQDKTVLNSHGVPIATIEGRRTPEQIEAAKRKRAAEEKARQDAVLARQRDQNLLATYLTVEEIESLRDRRAEILEAQARVTIQYLEQLRTKLAGLEKQALNFRPYNPDEKAQPMPDHLAEDLVRTVNEVRSQQRNLDTKRTETQKLREQFDRDIARFKELKRIETEYARSVQR